MWSKIFFFLFNRPVSPRLRAAFSRWLTSAEAARSVSVSVHFCLPKTQPAFLIVRLEKVHSFEENSFEVHAGLTIVGLFFFFPPVTRDAFHPRVCTYGTFDCCQSNVTLRSSPHRKKVAGLIPRSKVLSSAVQTD